MLVGRRWILLLRKCEVENLNIILNPNQSLIKVHSIYGCYPHMPPGPPEAEPRQTRVWESSPKCKDKPLLSETKKLTKMRVEEKVK